MVRQKFLIHYILVFFTLTLSASAQQNNETKKKIAQIIKEFKNQALKGYAVESKGLKQFRKENSFSGKVKLKVSNEGLGFSEARIEGTYSINDVLGKRKENVDITLIKNEFWKVLRDQKKYYYTKNINNTLSTTFSKAPIEIASIIKKLPETNVTIVGDDKSKNVYLLEFKLKTTYYQLTVDKTSNWIMSYTKRRDSWGKNGFLYTLKKVSFEKELGKPELSEFRKIDIPTKGYKAPNWSSYYIDKNKKVSLSDYRGKVVVMDFFASWCSPCIRAIPSLQKLYLTYKREGLQVLGMNYADRRNPMKILAKKGATYSIIKADKIGRDYEILNWPTTVIINKQGVIEDLFFGYRGEKTDKRIDELVEKLLKQ